jgi:hypothetical protein
LVRQAPEQVEVSEFGMDLGIGEYLEWGELLAVVLGGVEYIVAMSQSIRPKFYVDGEVPSVLGVTEDVPSRNSRMQRSMIPDWKWVLTLQNIMACFWSLMSFMKRLSAKRPCQCGSGGS